MEAQADPEWRHLGSSSNAEFYAMRADVMIVVPHVDTTDTEATARQSLTFQQEYWESQGHGGAVAVLMDNVLAQDAAARRVYSTETGGKPTTCYALVGRSFFAQATSAVYMGLTKPGVPTQIFESIEEAVPWMDKMNQERGSVL